MYAICKYNFTACSLWSSQICQVEQGSTSDQHVMQLIIADKNEERNGRSCDQSTYWWLGSDFDAAELHGLGLIVWVCCAGGDSLWRCLGSFRLLLVHVLLPSHAAEALSALRHIKPINDHKDWSSCKQAGMLVSHLLFHAGRHVKEHDSGEGRSSPQNDDDKEEDQQKNATRNTHCNDDDGCRGQLRRGCTCDTWLYIKMLMCCERLSVCALSLPFMRMLDASST